jgi:hypothetical protein
MAARPTLTGAGYVYPSDSQYSSNRMTRSGPVAPNGARFVALRVVSVTGGSSPFAQIRNGRSDSAPLVQQVAATNGATIDRRSTPDLCNDGLWLTVTGAPSAIDVEVLWK